MSQSEQDPSARRARSSVEHSIAIDAPADVIWALLADVDGWSRWNPVYTEASGSIGQGDGLRLTITLPGAKPMRSPATVYRSIPGRSLHFGAPALAGLLHATRYIEIETRAGGCTVLNGEKLGRLLGAPLLRLAGPRMREGLRLQNEGLKRAAEALAGRPAE